MQVKRDTTSPNFRTLGELKGWLSGLATVPDAAAMHVAPYGIGATWEEPTGTVRAPAIRPADLNGLREWVAGLGSAPDDARLDIDDKNFSISWSEER